MTSNDHIRHELASAITATIIARGWTQAQTATRLGTSQPTVSLLLRGHRQGFTTDRLVNWADSLGMSVRVDLAT